MDILSNQVTQVTEQGRENTRRSNRNNRNHKNNNRNARNSDNNNHRNNNTSNNNSCTSNNDNSDDNRNHTRDLNGNSYHNSNYNNNNNRHSVNNNQRNSNTNNNNNHNRDNNSTSSSRNNNNTNNNSNSNTNNNHNSESAIRYKLTRAGWWCKTQLQHRARKRSFLACFGGTIFLLGGFVCLLLYFISNEYSKLLMPGLSLFVVGVSVTAFGEWYCRAKLRQNNQRLREINDRHRADMLRMASHACRHRDASQAERNVTETPPSYFALYPPGYLVQRTLPEARTGGNGDALRTIELNNIAAGGGSAPPYSSLRDSVDAEERLPSYSDLVSDGLVTPKPIAELSV